jgi:hypothetical protein
MVLLRCICKDSFKPDRRHRKNMEESREISKGKSKKSKAKINKTADSTHLGSSNAFEETENPISKDPDDISDEKLDELLGE